MATIAAAQAEAGMYHVVACSNLGSTSAALPNNAWTQVPARAPSGLEAFVACPSMRGDRRDGIAAQDQVPGPSNVDAGAEVFWRFAAPPGTSITEISVARSLGKAGDESWRPYGRADGAVFDTCDIAPGQDVCENAGDATFAINNASTIDYGVRCDAPSGQCATGSSLHNVWTSLYAADVRSPTPARPRSLAGRAARCGTPPAITGEPRAPASGAATTPGSARLTGLSTAARRPSIAAPATSPGRSRAPRCRPRPSTA